MARGINKVILVGHLGRDPEVRYSPSGAAIANITVATSEGWKDKQTGEQQEKTEWHRVVFFSRLAEIAGEYLRKGSHVYIEGRLQTRKWQDKEGQDRYTTEIVANEMQMLGSRGGAGGQSSSSNNQFDQSAPSSAPTQSQSAPSSAPTQSQSTPKDFDDFDDDIPF